MGSPGYGSLIGLHSVHATRTLGLGQRHMPVEAFQERKRAARHQTLLRILSASSTDSCWLRSCTGPNCVLSAATGVQTNGTPGMLIRLLAVRIFMTIKAVSLISVHVILARLKVAVRITMEQQLLTK